MARIAQTRFSARLTAINSKYQIFVMNLDIR